MDAIVTAVELALRPRLRELADRLRVTAKKTGGEPVKPSQLDGDLKKAGAYGETERAQIAAWLKLRNDLAHRQDESISDARVAVVLDGLRVFLDEHPA